MRNARFMSLLATTLLLPAALLSTPGLAAAIATGQPLPPLQITELGECVVKGDDTAFQPWQSSQLRGRVHIVEYLAARAGVDAIQQPFYTALKAAQLPDGQVALAKVVNADDALFGTGGMVAPEVRKNKKARPGETLVVDAKGVGRTTWALQPKGSALAIVDADGTVLFFKEGALDAAEIARAVALVQQQAQ